MNAGGARTTARDGMAGGRMVGRMARSPGRGASSAVAFGRGVTEGLGHLPRDFATGISREHVRAGRHGSLAGGDLLDRGGDGVLVIRVGYDAEAGLSDEIP